MTHLAGKSGNVYVANLLLEDCEDAWESGTHGTASLESTIVKVGSGSAKTVMSAVENGDVVAFETMGEAKDIQTYTHILCWARASNTASAADFVIGIGTTASGATPTTQVDLPALVTDTWKYCHCTEVTGKEMADTSAGTIIGLEMNANAQDITIYLDDIRAAKNIAGIKSWTLDYNSDALETTDFAQAGVKSYIIGGSGWSGSFEGFKDGAPLSIGEMYGFEAAESATATQMWGGDIFITGVSASVSHDGIDTYSYTFQGTGELRTAST
jgi:predicted secreted protein